MDGWFIRPVEGWSSARGRQARRGATRSHGPFACWTSWGAACAIATSSPVAAAQAPKTATQLWDEGTAHLRAKQYELACPAIEESYRLDPRPGALFVAASCESERGKVLAALQAYEAYLALPSLPPSHGPRLAKAREEVQRLTPLVPRLELVAERPLEPGVVITLDGQTLPEDSMNRALPVEVGDHLLEARAESTPWQKAFVAHLGETVRIEWQPAPSHDPQPLAAEKSIETTVGRPGDTAPSAGAPETHRLTTLGWIVGGVGATGVIVGSVAGIAVLHQHQVVTANCDAHPDASGRKPCSPRGIQAVHRGQDFARVADVGFGVGILGLVAGATLLLWPTSVDAGGQTAAWDAQVGPTGAWLGVTEQW